MIQQMKTASAGGLHGAVFTLGFCGSPHQNDGIGNIQYDICKIRNFHHIHFPEEWMQKSRPSPGGRKKAAI